MITKNGYYIPEDEWYLNCHKVVCVMNEGYLRDLTVGKIYDIVSATKPGSNDKRDINYFSPITVTNDRGKIFSYNEERFVSLENWRQDKIKTLGI